MPSNPNLSKAHLMMLIRAISIRRIHCDSGLLGGGDPSITSGTTVPDRHARTCLEVNKDPYIDRYLSTKQGAPITN